MVLCKMKHFSAPGIKRPMVLSACAAVLICITAFYSDYPARVIMAIIFPSVLLMIAARQKPKAAAAVCCAFAVCIGVFNTYYKVYKLNLLCGKEIEGRFIATSDSVSYGDFSVLEVVSDDDALPRRTKLSLVYSGSQTVSSGDRFSASVKLSSLDGSEYKKTNYADGVYVSSYASKISSFASPDKFYRLLGQTRRYIISVIYSRLGGDTAGLLVAMTAGDKSYLSDNLYSNIKTAGISHVIVVSGLHLAILLGSLFKFLNVFVKNKYARFLLLLFSTLFIMGVCGFTMSILRAGLMYIIAAFAPLIGRENDSFNTLGTAVTLILVFVPFSIFSISFQLSVLATYSIIVISPFYTKLLTEYLHIKNIILHSVFSMFMNTLSATFMTLPVIIRCFGYVSAVSPITNLLVTYAVSWGLSFAALAVLVSLIGPLYGITNIFLLLSGLCSKYMICVIDFLSHLPFAAIQLGKSAFIASLVFIAALIAYMRVFMYRREMKRNSVEE